MISAPAAQASSATRARYVSILMAMLSASGIEVRMCLIAGMTRESSSASPTGADPGRVLSPPMSIIVAPDAMKERTVFVKAVKSVGGWRPPSEKESGVRLRMAIMWVGRPGSVGCRVGKVEEIWVVEKGVEVGAGRELRWERNVSAFPRMGNCS